MVIRLTTEVELAYTQIDLPEGVLESVFYISDSETRLITPIILRAISLIEASLERKERVLVHCEAGISRSASVVIAFIMKSKSMTVERSRSCVWPNKGFWRELTKLKFND